jgi:MFS family permease
MKTTYQNNLKILPWVAVCTSFDALLPFFVIYEQKCGLSYLQIFITQVVFSISVILFDIPLGVMADIYSRRYLLILGQIFFCLAFALFMIWPTFLGFAFGEFFFALSYAARTGIDTSLLFETTKHLEIEESYSQEEGKYQSYARYSEGISAVFGGFTALISLKMPVLVTWLVSFPSIFLGFFLYEKNTKVSSGFSEKLSKRLISHTLFRIYEIRYSASSV